MNKIKSLITILSFITLLLFLGQSSIIAQRVVQVPQGVGTLNEAIDGDTTAIGERTWIM